jgi:hypothetical protein
MRIVTSLSQLLFFLFCGASLLAGHELEPVVQGLLIINGLLLLLITWARGDND